MGTEIKVTEQVSQVTVVEQQLTVNVAPEEYTVAVGDGPQGPSGVIQVNAPLVNSGTSTQANISLSTDGNLETVGGALKVTDDLTAIDSVTFDQTAAETSAVGKLFWDDADGTLSLGLKGGNVTLQVGQEQNLLVKDKDNAGLAEGAVVYQHGSSGENILVGLAKADSEAASAQVLGVMTEPTTGGAKGFCTTFGLVRGLNTSAMTEGAAVWLSPTVPGGMTTTKPANGYHLVQVGYCLRSHSVNGVIFVKVQNGYELEELHDVDIVTPSDGQVLAYESASGLWKNKTKTGVVAASSPITYNAGTQTVGIDQTSLAIAQSQVTSLVTDLAGKSPLPAFGNPLVSGVYATTSSGAGNISPLEAYEVVSPMICGRDANLNRIGIHVQNLGSTGAVIRLGIRAFDSATGRPGNVILDAGTVDATTIGWKEIAINVNVTKGQIICLSATVQGAATTRPTVFGTGASPIYTLTFYDSSTANFQYSYNGWQRSGVTGALSNAGGWSNHGFVVARVGVRAT